MANDRAITASLLHNGASAYAGYAATLLLERHPEVAARFAPDAFAGWKGQLHQRVRELAVAVELDDAEMFTAGIRWSQEVFVLRGVPTQDLTVAVDCLREVLLEELPEDGHAALRECFDRAASLPEGAAAEHPESPLDSPSPLVLSYLEACLSGEPRSGIDIVLQAVAGGMAVRSTLIDVLARAQREVGRLWLAGEVGVHEEHIVTSTSVDLVALLVHQAVHDPPNGKTVLTGAVREDSHSLGLRIVTEFFSLSGWKAIGLGSSLPAADLARAARDFQVDLVVLSATMIQQIRHVHGTVKVLRDASPAKILLGGGAFQSSPDSWKKLGADGYATSPEEAVVLGARLVGLST